MPRLSDVVFASSDNLLPTSNSTSSSTSRMPPSLESEELLVVGNDGHEYARNKTNLPPLASAIDPNVPIGRLGGKRSSSGRRSSRQDPLDRLRALPQIRPIPWYPGKELPPEKSTLSDRVQTRSACLMASRGRVNIPPCSHCATGLGRFSMCISLDDFLSGACSTCHLAARGNSCSIRLKVASDTQSQIDRQEEQSQSPQGHWDRRGRSQQSSSQPEPEPESSAEPQNPSPARGAKAGRQPLPTATIAWTPVEHQIASTEISNIPVEQSISNLKRKRETLQGTDVWKPYVSPYRPVEPPPRSTQTSSRSRNSFTPTDASHEEVPLLNYIYRKDAPVNGASKHKDTATASSLANPRPTREKIWEFTPEYSTRATVASNEHANHSAPRDASVSMSPSDQLLNQQATRSIEPGDPPQSRTRDRSSVIRHSARENILIDALPRKKQSQIYSIIDNLQGGIGDCQRQAESMQKQLDSLKAMLGIEKQSNNGASSS